MDFRRFDHMDEMLNVARNCSNDLKLAKLRIAVLKWLIAHDGRRELRLASMARRAGRGRRLEDPNLKNF
jgi:hypothetical protein